MLKSLHEQEGKRDKSDVYLMVMRWIFKGFFEEAVGIKKRELVKCTSSLILYINYRLQGK